MFKSQQITMHTHRDTNNHAKQQVFREQGCERNFRLMLIKLVSIANERVCECAHLKVEQLKFLQ